jgi:hypothetical protein
MVVELASKLERERWAATTIGRDSEPRRNEMTKLYEGAELGRFDPVEYERIRREAEAARAEAFAKLLGAIGRGIGHAFAKIDAWFETARELQAASLDPRVMTGYDPRRQKRHEISAIYGGDADRVVGRPANDDSRKAA